MRNGKAMWPTVNFMIGIVGNAFVVYLPLVRKLPACVFAINKLLPVN